MDMISAPTGPEPVEENRVTTGDATGDASAAPAQKSGRNLPAAIAVGVLLGAACSCRC